MSGFLDWFQRLATPVTDSVEERVKSQRERNKEDWPLPSYSSDQFDVPMAEAAGLADVLSRRYGQTKQQEAVRPPFVQPARTDQPVQYGPSTPPVRPPFVMPEEPVRYGPQAPGDPLAAVANEPVGFEEFMLRQRQQKNINPEKWAQLEALRDRIMKMEAPDAAGVLYKPILGGMAEGVLGMVRPITWAADKLGIDGQADEWVQRKQAEAAKYIDESGATGAWKGIGRVAGNLATMAIPSSVAMSAAGAGLKALGVANTSQRLSRAVGLGLFNAAQAMPSEDLEQIVTRTGMGAIGGALSGNTTDLIKKALSGKDINKILPDALKARVMGNMMEATGDLATAAFDAAGRAGGLDFKKIAGDNQFWIDFLAPQLASFVAGRGERQQIKAEADTAALVRTIEGEIEAALNKAYRPPLAKESAEDIAAAEGANLAAPGGKPPADTPEGQPAAARGDLRSRLKGGEVLSDRAIRNYPELQSKEEILAHIQSGKGISGWRGDREGNLDQYEVAFKNPLVVTGRELDALQKKYATINTKNRTDKAGSIAFTKDLMEQGYDGVIRMELDKYGNTRFLEMNQFPRTIADLEAGNAKRMASKSADPGDMGVGQYFSSVREIAEAYALGRKTMRREPTSAGGREYTTDDVDEIFSRHNPNQQDRIKYLDARTVNDEGKELTIDEINKDFVRKVDEEASRPDGVEVLRTAEMIRRQSIEDPNIGVTVQQARQKEADYIAGVIKDIESRKPGENQEAVPSKMVAVDGEKADVSPEVTRETQGGKNAVPEVQDDKLESMIKEAKSAGETGRSGDINRGTEIKEELYNRGMYRNAGMEEAIVKAVETSPDDVGAARDAARKVVDNLDPGEQYDNLQKLHRKVMGDTGVTAAEAVVGAELAEGLGRSMSLARKAVVDAVKGGGDAAAARAELAKAEARFVQAVEWVEQMHSKSGKELQAGGFKVDSISQEYADLKKIYNKLHGHTQTAIAKGNTERVRKVMTSMEKPFYEAVDSWSKQHGFNLDQKKINQVLSLFREGKKDSSEASIFYALEQAGIDVSGKQNAKVRGDLIDALRKKSNSVSWLWSKPRNANPRELITDSGTIDRGSVSGIRDMIDVGARRRLLALADQQYKAKGSPDYFDVKAHNVKEIKSGTSERDIVVDHKGNFEVKLTRPRQLLNQHFGTITTLSQLLNFKTPAKNLISNVATGLAETAADYAAAKFAKAWSGKYKKIGISGEDTYSHFTPKSVTALSFKHWQSVFSEDAKTRIKGIDKSREILAKFIDEKIIDELGLADDLKFAMGGGDSTIPLVGDAITKLNDVLGVALRSTDLAAFACNYQAKMTNFLNIKKALASYDEMKSADLSTQRQAAKEALEATLMDSSSLATGMEKFKNWCNRGKSFGLADLMLNLRYVRAPMNVVMRIVEYAPLISIGNIRNKIKEMKADGYSKVSRRNFEKSVGKSAVGIMASGAGAAIALAVPELFRALGSPNEDIRKLEEEAGEQENSLRVPKWVPGLGGKSVGLSDLGPLGAALFIGVGAIEKGNIASDKAIDADKSQEFALGLTSGVLEGVYKYFVAQPTVEGMARASEPLYNALKGKSDVATFFRQTGGAFMSNAVMTVLPSLFRNAAIASDVRRTANPFIKKDAPIIDHIEGMFVQAFNTVAKYIPGVRETVPTIKDSFGNEIKYGSKDSEDWVTMTSFLFNPFIMKDINYSPEAQKSLALYRAAGVLLRTPKALTQTPKSFMIGDQEYIMNEEQAKGYQGLIKEGFERVLRKYEFVEPSEERAKAFVNAWNNDLKKIQQSVNKEMSSVMRGEGYVPEEKMKPGVEADRTFDREKKGERQGAAPSKNFKPEAGKKSPFKKSKYLPSPYD